MKTRPLLVSISDVDMHALEYGEFDEDMDHQYSDIPINEFTKLLFGELVDEQLRH